MKSKQSNTFFLALPIFSQWKTKFHDDLRLTDPSIIPFGEESLLNTLLHGSDSVFQNKCLRFNIP